MNPLHYLIPFIIMLHTAQGTAQKSTTQSDVDKKVEALLAKMTLEEKVGQMNLYNGFWEITGPAP
ncbi:MAG: hypothetical protein AAF849_13650, partial [Bacteroidota bacterium]